MSLCHAKDSCILLYKNVSSIINFTCDIYIKGSINVINFYNNEHIFFVLSIYLQSTVKVPGVYNIYTECNYYIYMLCCLRLKYFVRSDRFKSYS